LADTAIRPQSFAPDGRRLAHIGAGIHTIPLDLSDPDNPRVGQSEPMFLAPRLHDAEFSPDGRWMAYTVTDGGREQVFVEPVPAAGVKTGGKWRISAGGGKFPRWSRAAKELFFREPTGRIMVAEYSVKGDSFSTTPARVWSDRRLLFIGILPPFDLAPDGKRIIGFPRPESEQENAATHVTFLLNFFDELRRRVPWPARACHLSTQDCQVTLARFPSRVDSCKRPISFSPTIWSSLYSATRRPLGTRSVRRS
jgi:hypothetical protein